MDNQGRNVVPLNVIGSVNIAQKLDAGEDLSLLEKITITDILNRRWRPHLTPQEYYVVSYIIGRSVSYSKKSFIASLPNIVEGTSEHCGVGMSLSALKRGLTSLADKGLITRKQRPYCVKIIINVAWRAEEMALPIPKRLRINAQLSGNPASQLVQKPASQLVQNRTTEYSILKTSNKDSSVAFARNANDDPDDFVLSSPEEKKEELHPGSNSSQGFVSAFAGTHEQLDAARKKAAEHSPTKTRPTTSDFENIWRAGIAETFPEATITGWGVKERSMMATVAKKWPAQNTTTFAMLVDWAVRNWPQIIRQHFNWMKDAPKTPSLTFFTSDKLRARLAGAMMEGNIQRFVNSDDVDELQRRMLAGQTHDDAVAAIGKSKAVIATREETNKKLATAADLNAKANMTLAKADKRVQIARDTTAENLADKLIEKGIALLTAHKTDTSKPLVQTIDNYEEKRRATAKLRFKTPVREKNPNLHPGST